MELADGYAEIETAALNHACVDAVWTHFSKNEKHHFILPDGRTDIILTFLVDSYGVPTNITPIIATPSVYSQLITILPHQGFLGIRLKPGVVQNFFTAPLHAMGNGILNGKRAIFFLQSRHALQCNCTSISSLLTELNRFVLGIDSSCKSSWILDAIKIIDESKGCINVAETAKQLGLCERTLRRVFLRSVGLSPKAYSSTVRLHNALKLLSNNCDKMACIASDCGYSDQPHMIRDFKNFTGYTPEFFKGKQHESLLAQLL